MLPWFPLIFWRLVLNLAFVLHTLAGSSILAILSKLPPEWGGQHLGPIGSAGPGKALGTCSDFWESRSNKPSAEYHRRAATYPTGTLPLLIPVLLLLRCASDLPTSRSNSGTALLWLLPRARCDTAQQDMGWLMAFASSCHLQFPHCCLPTHSFSTFPQEKTLVFVITGFQLFVFRLQLICWHHFEYYSLRDLQSSLLDTTHIFIFPLCELCSRALPRKFHWDWTAVTGLECKFARQTTRDCIRSLIWGVFIPSPLTTLLLSQNEIRLTRHNLFPVNSYSTHDTVI